MKTTKITGISYIFIVLSAIIILLCFLPPNVAIADENDNYEIIYPSTDYIQLTSPSSYFYDGAHYIYDSSKIIALGDTLSFYNIDCNVKQFVKCGENFIINTGDSFKKLSTTTGACEDITLGSATADFILYTYGSLSNIIAINNVTGETIVFDDSFSPVKEQTLPYLANSYTYCFENFIYSVSINFTVETGLKFYVYKTDIETFSRQTLFEIEAHGRIFVGNKIAVLQGDSLFFYDENGADYGSM